MTLLGVAERERLLVRKFFVLAFVTACFFPYAAVPLGASTNVPISSVLAFALLRWTPHMRGFILSRWSILAFAPVVPSALLAFSGRPINVNALVVWPLHIAPIIGFACAFIISRRGLSSTTKRLVLLTALLTFLQLAFILRGSIPFVTLYELPGYASVKAQEVAILAYIKRPFAQFPEPSFLAGSVALAVALILICDQAREGRLRNRILFWVALGAIVISAARSGSGVLTLAALVVSTLSLLPRTAFKPFVGLILTGTALAIGASLYDERNAQGNNFSWGDRASSIQNSVEFLFSSFTNVVLGVGKGMLTSKIREGAVDLGTSSFQADVSSVTIRLIVEVGIIGMFMVYRLARLTWTALPKDASLPSKVPLFAVWATVVTATVTYDSAALLWCLPGVGLATLAARARGAS